MRVQLYRIIDQRSCDADRYTLVQRIGEELVMRPWPWSSRGDTEFFAPTQVEEAEMVEIEQSPKSQAKASEKPDRSQAEARWQPEGSQAKAIASLGKSQGLDCVAPFDELAHYHQHLHVVAAMQRPDVWREAVRCTSFSELAQVSTFPRPAVKALNQLLRWERSREFYMNLYRIHQLVEQQRPMWVVAVFEKWVFGIVDRIIYQS